MSRETGYYKAILKGEHEWTVINIFSGSDDEQYITVIGSDEEFRESSFSEIGEKLDLGSHIHVWDKILANCDDFAGLSVVYACECGVKLTPELDNYSGEVFRMRDYRNTPGAVFEVIEND